MPLTRPDIYGFWLANPSQTEPNSWQCLDCDAFGTSTSTINAISAAKKHGTLKYHAVTITLDRRVRSRG